MKNEIIILKNKQAVTTSLKVAEVFHKRHDNVLADISKLDCSDRFRLLNFKESSYINEQNKEHPMYYITRDGFTFLAMGYRGKKAAQFKEAYIDAFNQMEDALKEISTQDWIETRRRGKLARKSETDMIQKLVEYAKEQGSSHPDMLYMVYSKLANNLVGIKERDKASVIQLNTLAIYENICLKEIEDGMKHGLGYKEIYQNSKIHCESAKDIALLQNVV